MIDVPLSWLSTITDNGLYLEQVYKDQDPNFFIEKGIKIGTARQVVEDTQCWEDSVIPIGEVN